MTTIHTRQLQQYTQDNYNNTYKTTNNNTHKTTTSIHTRQLTTTHTRQLTTIHTKQLTTIRTRHLKIQHVQKVNNTTVTKYCTQFLVFFPTHNLITLSPQPFTSHHFATHINFSHKVSFLPHSLHCTSLHFISRHCTFRWFPANFIFLLGLHATTSRVNNSKIKSFFKFSVMWTRTDGRFVWCVSKALAASIFRVDVM